MTNVGAMIVGRDEIAGLLLTGGASRRMGADKASLVVHGEPLARRIAGLLTFMCRGPLIEVGPGRSGFPAVTEDPPGSGPLAAVAAGAGELGRLGWSGSALVLSCDLPLLSAPALALLARWPGEDAVVPQVGGRRQPLCARWSPADLTAAVTLAASGQRSLHGLPGAGGVVVLTEADWSGVADARSFSDADTPEELAALIRG